jgi:anaerobic magnesium-protoporphyrin IX monomethyl ester cyclase
VKVLLIFPPLWIPYRPYLSLPSLCAYLKSKGIDVVQKDFNVEAYDLLLSEGYLKGLKEKLEDRFDKIDSKDRLMPGLEQEYYYDLYKAKSSLDYIAERIEHAKGIFRNKQAFYDINALFGARNTLKQAQVIISTGCFPTGQDLIWPINVRFQRSPEDIKQITQDRNENPFLGFYEKHLLPFILKEDPDVVGISITVDGQLIPALTLSRLVKSSLKKAHVVVGGYIITMLSEILMKYEELFSLFLDSAVLNEGEGPLLKLVEHISHGQTLEDVPNLIYFDHGKICANPVLPAEDINSLPTPCFDGLPLGLYLSPEPVLPILSSRGCYWGKCAFCSHIESYRGHYQTRDAGKVVDDMQELIQKHGVRHFGFSDEGISPASMSKISDEIIKRGLNVRCSTNVRLERQFTPELCNKMFQAGFRLLFLGLESACDRVLNHMEKGTTREIAAEVCKNAHDAGIWDHLYVFFGFPTETRAEAQETIDFLLSKKHIIRSFSLDSFILAKGAPVAKFPERYGISEIDSGPANDFNFAYNYKVSSGMTSSEALNLVIEHRDRITREYDSQKFFQLECENVILYLSHFEKSDPYLTAAIKVNATNTQMNKQLTRLSAPRLKRSVVLNRIRFDIMDIVNNIINYQAVTAFPRTTSPIFDPGSGKLWTVEPRAVEFFSFCDGQKTIEKIAKDLSKKYNAPQFKIEEDCIAFLQPLLREGYVIF